MKIVESPPSEFIKYTRTVEVICACLHDLYQQENKTDHLDLP